jgi:hypothetical protein
MIKFVEVKAVSRRGKHHLYDFLDSFMQSDVSIAKVDYNEKDYANANSCYCCMHRAVKQHGFAIKVYLRKGIVYLVKI